MMILLETPILIQFKKRQKIPIKQIKRLIRLASNKWTQIDVV